MSHEYAVDYTVKGDYAVKAVNVHSPFYVNVKNEQQLAPLVEQRVGLPSGSVKVCHALLQNEPR